MDEKTKQAFIQIKTLAVTLAAACELRLTDSGLDNMWIHSNADEMIDESVFMINQFLKKIRT